MSRMAWRLLADGVLGLTGLVMLFWALETVYLVSASGARHGTPTDLAFTTYLMMFAGLLLGTGTIYDGMRRWSIYLRGHPRTSQAPAWFLTLVMIVGGVALIGGLVIHTAYIADLAQVPTRPGQGYVLFQVVAAVLVLLPLVPLSVRWAPGYRRAMPAKRG